LRRIADKLKAGEYLGDIAISPATARRYARQNGRKLSSELRVLILHGVLHLLGYDHETDRGEMDRVERKLRKRFGLA
jgi:probable rRNA maturation factor